MIYRLEAGSEVHLLIFLTDYNEKSRQGERSFAYESYDCLEEDLLIDPKSEIISPKNGRRTNIFNLGRKNPEMKKYFPRLPEFNQKERGSFSEVWLVADKHDLVKETVK
ncbi:MAG: hypothetical protein ACK4RT_05620 [Erythrobacter sp.]